mmetsp:Transcript_38471/g.108808  ORF Transcript_38471/g.108808 Transcript_38471/m.108808 type:complete len:82 (-) Transcript_38471:253-498(-)
MMGRGSSAEMSSHARRIRGTTGLTDERELLLVCQSGNLRWFQVCDRDDGRLDDAWGETFPDENPEDWTENLAVDCGLTHRL